jgi:hypothetical protein
VRAQPSDTLATLAQRLHGMAGHSADEAVRCLQALQQHRYGRPVEGAPALPRDWWPSFQRAMKQVRTGASAR